MNDFNVKETLGYYSNNTIKILSETAYNLHSILLIDSKYSNINNFGYFYLSKLKNLKKICLCKIPII